MIRRLALGLALLVAAPSVAQTVKTAQGAVEGVVLDGGVQAWLGVPFAAPPVRDLRWRAPQPVQPWSGVYHADHFAPMCLQPLRNRTMNHYFGNEATSEDCLYLNIWSPSAPAPAGKPYPVIVWIYGGGFTIGSANMSNYSGAAMARKGVIQVNIAYRVGNLGFFAHPELTREAGGASGNYGLMDQIAGLQWVQQNIAAFGGDPHNVTLMGQSAGSMSVALLQASPAARGLFHRVVGMSGSPLGDLLAPEPLAEAEADGQRFAAAIGANSIEALRDMSGDRIAAAPFVRRGPITIDGRILPESPAAIFAAGKQANVPAMLGFTRDESFRPLGPVHDIADFGQVVRKAFPAQADAILKAYPVATDAEAERAARDLQRDATVGSQMAAWARFQKAPTWAWLFSRRHPYAEGVTFSDHDPMTVGAYHTGDVPYWLGTLDALNMFRTTRNWTAADRALMERMQSMIISFAHGSAPDTAWPVFDARHPRVLELDVTTRVTDWPHYKALGLLVAPGAPARDSEPRKPRD